MNMTPLQLKHQLQMKILINQIDLYIYLIFQLKLNLKQGDRINFGQNILIFLKSLTYHGSLSKDKNEELMIKSFQEFRSKWKYFAKVNSHQFYLVSDNTVYDGDM